MDACPVGARAHLLAPSARVIAWRAARTTPARCHLLVMRIAVSTVVPISLQAPAASH
jgi:hypothetical protein